MTHNQVESAPVDEASQPFVGRWNELVSTTNWEKGRIIAEWREALVAAGADVAEYADEAWSTRVGGVTPQHVGRLRRVYQRFHATHAQYAGLYWSHFQAAIDWTDAEMWLEGAVHSQWSVASMRRTRAEATGAVDALQSQADEIATADLEEDFVPAADAEVAAEVDRPKPASSDEPSGPKHDGPDFGDEEDWPEKPETDADESHVGDDVEGTEGSTAGPTVRPFAHLAALPEDVSEPFEALKLAILHHKREGWTKVSCDDVLAALDALKTLAIAPAE